MGAEAGKRDRGLILRAPPLRTAGGLRIPADHPFRVELNDEVHARPPEALQPPQRLSYLALLSDWTERERDWEEVRDLARRLGAPPPGPESNHCSVDLGPFRLKWERHTEFKRFKFIAPGSVGEGFATPAIAEVPADWLAALKGRTMMAAHVALAQAEDPPADAETLSARLFGGNVLIGADIAGRAGTAYTDFRIHGDGFSRMLVLSRSLTPRQAGRMIQRLLEIDTYRMMALLAWPVARETSPVLSRWERELAEVTNALACAQVVDEPGLLERLTRLQAEIETREAENHYRFSAAAAYYELVQRRIAELREERIQGLQTFQEFTERRLGPAMNTCRAVADRQDALSRRIARATQLLSTRVDLTREQQNQALLESMDRRAKLQLRLQETVEGLSVAAVTYYAVGLIGYAANALRARGAPIQPELIMGISIPLIALLVALAVRRVRRMVAHDMG